MIGDAVAPRPPSRSELVDARRLRGQLLVPGRAARPGPDPHADVGRAHARGPRARRGRLRRGTRRAHVILENGVIRTMDPSLADVRRARDRRRPRRGRRRDARVGAPDARPRRSRAAAACSRPSPTRTSTSRRWSLARRDVQLEGAASLAEALDRVRASTRGRQLGPRHGLARRGLGRAADGRGARRTSPAIDAGGALGSKDYHSLWLNTAALALADGDLEVPGGVVERDEDGAPTGVLREESAWQFRERFVTVSEDEWVDATRDGHPRREQPRRRRDPRQGRLARRAAPIFGRIHEREGLTLRVWQSLPARAVRRARRRCGCAPASATTSCGSAT